MIPFIVSFRCVLKSLKKVSPSVRWSVHRSIRHFRKKMPGMEAFQCKGLARPCISFDECSHLFERVCPSVSLSVFSRVSWSSCSLAGWSVMISYCIFIKDFVSRTLIILIDASNHRCTHETCWDLHDHDYHQL